MKEKKIRSLVKAISWRIIASIVTGSLVFIFTSRLKLAVGIGILDVAVKLIVYYVHERIWTLIPFGKNYHPLEDIPVKKPITDEDKELIKKLLKDLGYMD